MRFVPLCSPPFAARSHRKRLQFFPQVFALFRKAYVPRQTLAVDSQSLAVYRQTFPVRR
jgi:hypothetical protein